ncbi:MAG: hypothetical protein NXH97_01170 [Rhodobacteraceae bacterium]|nr:hypothetical protein [Paracoccaceae bacterium]
MPSTSLLASLALVALLVRPACDPGPATTYPVTGAEVGPDDPVQELEDSPLVEDQI